MLLETPQAKTWTRELAEDGEWFYAYRAPVSCRVRVYRAPGEMLDLTGDYFCDVPGGEPMRIAPVQGVMFLHPYSQGGRGLPPDFDPETAFKGQDFALYDLQRIILRGSLTHPKPQRFVLMNLDWPAIFALGWHTRGFPPPLLPLP